MRDKVVVITGARGILGSAAAEEARARGAKAVLLDIHAPDATPAELSFAVDLGDPAAVSAVMSAIRERAGRIDALLNIAGGFVWKTVEQGDIADWQRMFALNVGTAFNASKAAAPHLIESGGAIVNVGAHAAIKAGAGMGAYTASKMGVMKLTESMAEELKGKVRVKRRS
jgi:NAD(P)-dependent dehydrogenase (short-subunit alcohol dehydrogenase family)